MTFVSFLPSILGVLHFALVVGISLRVIIRRANSGVALPWLFIVAAFPFVGAVVYFQFGEKRISKLRGQRIFERGSTGAASCCRG